MKTLELQLNKRLLIVESENANEFFIMKNIPAGTYDMICEGSELTEDIAEDLVAIFDLSYYVDYNGHSPRCYVDTALESFISAIESKGYHWGDNPVKFNDDEVDFEKRHKNRIEWEQSESRTFSPEKCIIFEIL